MPKNRTRKQRPSDAQICSQGDYLHNRRNETCIVKTRVARKKNNSTNTSTQHSSTRTLSVHIKCFNQSIFHFEYCLTGLYSVDCTPWVFLLASIKCVSFCFQPMSKWPMVGQWDRVYPSPRASVRSVAHFLLYYASNLWSLDQSIQI